MNTMSEFWGFPRWDGNVGIRNHLLILPTIQYVNYPAQRIASSLAGAISLENVYGYSQLGSDAKQTASTLEGFALNPNVGACIIIGLDCEQVNGEEIAQKAALSGKEVEYVNMNREDCLEVAIAKAIKYGVMMSQKLSGQKRSLLGVEHLILSLECGGSDSWSGLSANPVLGECSDILISFGATAILSETQEMIGAEHLFATRAVDREVGERFLNIVRYREQESIEGGVDISSVNPSPGNKEGGLTTIEEKSLGCLQKGGTQAHLVEVLDYAQRPSKRGLIFMDTPGDDVESITGMTAGGSQICIFTTGRGSCVGCPIVPVIKVSSNTPMYEQMKDNIDFNAGVVADGTKTITQSGRELYELMLRVCSGEATKSEILRCDSNFSITRTGITL
jgi:altronate dehydratase large subunit